MTQFASMFVSLTLLPERLAAPPYALSPTLIGVCFLPSGFGMMAGSVVGGRASDRAADGAYASRRLVPALAGSLLLPLGCFGYGFFFENGVHLAAPLVRALCLCVCVCVSVRRLSVRTSSLGGSLSAMNIAASLCSPTTCTPQISHAVLGFGQAFYMVRGRRTLR